MALGPLVDTSVLIDYFAGVQSPETDLLDQLLEGGPSPSTAPIIVQEYLQGLTDPGQFEEARRALALFHRLQPPDYPLHETVAALVARERRRGRTYSAVDSLIVVMADKARCGLLTRDAAQAALARTLGVPVVR